MASGIGGAADEAARLATNLAIAKVNQNTLAASKVYSGRGGDPRQFMPGGSQASYTQSGDYKSVDELIKELSPKAGGGGGQSQAEKDHNKRLEEAKRIIRDVRTETEIYNDELADLNELQRLGYLNASQYAKAVDKVNEAYRETQFEQVQQGIDNISSAIGDAIASGEDLGEAFRSVINQMAADLISSGIRDLLTEMLIPKGGGAAGGILSAIVDWIGGGVRSAKGNVFSHGRLTEFAKGGVVSQPTLFPMAKGMGLMGEAGPEAVMPLRRGPDGKLGVQASGGGAKVVNVNINVSGAKGNAEIMEMVRAGVTAGMSEADKNFEARMEDASRDPRVRF